jgi:hypothetical protein
MDLPIITPHDSLFAQSAVFGFNQYGKAALGYLALKDLMGDAAFRTALHTFMARWNGKRPLPWDMFNSFNDAGVGNHTWFFRNWFFSYNYMDLALDGVRSEGGVQTVAVRNPGGMAILLRPGGGIRRRQQRARAPHASRLARGRSPRRGATASRKGADVGEPRHRHLRGCQPGRQ